MRPQAPAGNPRAGHRGLLVVAGAAIALGVAFPLVAGGGVMGGITGAGGGAAMAGSGVAYARWFRRLGKFTSVVALALIWAALVTAIMEVSPHCGAASGQRCTLQQGAQWSVTGFLIPILPAVAILPGFGAYRAARAFVRALWRRARGKKAPIWVRRLRGAARRQVPPRPSVPARGACRKTRRKQKRR